MALVTITNLTGEIVLLQELYRDVKPYEVFTITRERDELHAMPELQEYWKNGIIEVAVVSDAAEDDFIDQKLHTVGLAALFSGTPELVDSSPASDGVQSTAAKGDHKHDVLIATAVELTDTTNSEGTGAALTKANHLHAHGDRAGGTLHALATITVPGFMSPSDKEKIDDLFPISAKSWSFETVNAGIDYIGGFYDFFSGDDDFSPAAINFGHADRAVSAHVFVVIGAVPVGLVQITVTGDSIDDLGNPVLADSEVINVPNSSAVGSYFETSKKFNGVVTFQTTLGTAITCNYGWSKYHDSNNTDFTVRGLEALWSSEANDTTSDLALLHHKATGWTFNAGSTPTPPAAIARRTTDLGANNAHANGFPGAWKRTNLNQAIAGSASEGIIVEITSEKAGVGSQSFRLLNFEVSLSSG
jgi:hypothetical protein